MMRRAIFFWAALTVSLTLSILPSALFARAGILHAESGIAFAQSGVAREYGLKDIDNVQLRDRTRFTTNPDGILSPDAVRRIDATLLALKESGKAQVAVIAVNSIGDADPHDFLVTLMHKDTGWGVGSGTSDNGLGILLVIDQGAIEIATGYGLEGDLPDAIAKRVINRYMLPAFRERNWDKGMVDGVTVISEILNGRPPEDVKGGKGGSGILLLIILFFGIFIVLAIVAAYNSSRCPRCRKRKLKETDDQIIDNGKGRRTEVITYVCQNCGYVKTVKRDLDGGNGLGGMGGGMIIGSMLGRGFGGRGFGGGHSGGSWGGGGFGGGGAGGRF